MSFRTLIAPFCFATAIYLILRYGRLGMRGKIILAAAVVFLYEVFHRQNFGNVAFLIIFGFAVYAWRDWFVSLGAAILLMAFLENRDTPHGFLGIQGLNPWNVVILNVLLAWWVNRHRQGLSWDMPRHIVVLAMFCLFVIVWSFSRLVTDYSPLENMDYGEGRMGRISVAWITSEYLVNCLKWVLPAIVLYDACRTRARVLGAITFILALYFLVALQVLQIMPLSAATNSGSALARMGARDLDQGIGYFRTELSMMLACASWGIISCAALVRQRKYQLLVFIAAGIVSLAQSLTGGRAGYLTWGMTGMILCLVRWRWLLPAVPIGVAAVFLFLPGVSGRLLQGFGGEGSGQIDEFSITSGRNVAWSYVIPKIEESPIFGYGREAMIRSGTTQRIMADFGEGESFPHPHNAYLELLLDDGIVGFLLMMPLYLVVLWHSFQLLVDRSDPIFSMVGGVSAALILGLMIASLSAQTFYPRESSVGMWAAAGVMLRVYVERKRSMLTGEPLFGESQSEDGHPEMEEDLTTELAPT
jgi:O-antigen ligase